MRPFVFAALLALPLLGLGATSASADYYCCGKKDEEHKVRWAYVVKDSVVFDCDSYHCQTKIKVHGGTKVKTYCKNGWCHIKNYPFSHMWVLENCLKFHDGESEYKKGDEGGDEGGESGGEEEGGEGKSYERQGYKRSYDRRY